MGTLSKESDQLFRSWYCSFSLFLWFMVVPIVGGLLWGFTTVLEHLNGWAVTVALLVLVQAVASKAAHEAVLAALDGVTGSQRELSLKQSRETAIAFRKYWTPAGWGWCLVKQMYALLAWMARRSAVISAVRKPPPKWRKP